MIGQSRQLIESIFRPAKSDRDVATLHMAGFIQALTERAYTVLVFVRRSKESYILPTGIAGCCARAVSGHAAAAPPSSDMNSRRLLSNIGLPAPWVPQALGPRFRQVLAAGLNHSESCERSQAPGLCQNSIWPRPSSARISS